MIMKAIVSLSGGLDSTTVLATVLAAGRQVATVGFYYRSKHNQFENAAARVIAAYYQVPFRLIDLSGVMEGFRSDLMESGGNIPEGHYEAESMRRTVVPGRNSIFASILLGIAESEDASEIWLGIHAGDHHIYPDCRPGWLTALRNLVAEASEGKVAVAAPFLDVDKGEIVKQGLQLNVPYQLTRTCYKAQVTACGRCGSCQERLAAFRANNVDDPLAYEFRGMLEKEVLM